MTIRSGAVRSGASVLALAFGMAAGPVSAQQTIVVRSGQTDTGRKTVSGTDSVTIQQNGTLQTTGASSINWADASTGLVITNAGTIRNTAAGGRAIQATGNVNERTITLTNAAGALIESPDDAFRIALDPTAGTIRIDNAGTIRTLAGGQAIDFDAVASGGAQITINNAATGVLRSFGQDAVRPGQSATVNNAGLIYADGVTGNSYDGIDWQGKFGTVTNQATGTISGLRHGITSNTNVQVTNAGTIIGRNGSGVGSDGDGTVTNSGTITGQWDGVAANGDGDGVDIDGIGRIVNSGIIQGLRANGVDSSGSPNTAQGIAMGGGSIENTATGSIYGEGSAILVDNGQGGNAAGATTILNAGEIRAGTGTAIQLVGFFADRITNSGTIVAGGNGQAISTGGGADTIFLDSGSTVRGAIDTGSQSDTLTLASDALVDGAVETGTGADTVSLAAGARINAAVSLGADDDTLVLQGGTIAGAVDLGTGNDAVTIDGGTIDAGAGALAINGGSGLDTLVLSRAQIIGNIDLGAQNDRATIQSNTRVAGALATGTGDDNVQLLSNATVEGPITLGDDDDAITVAGGATASAGIDAGAGNDAVTVDGGTVLAAGTNPAISTGAGNDTIVLANNGRVTGAIVTGDDNDTLSVRSGAAVAGAVDLGTGSDAVSVDGGSIEVAAGGDAITTGTGSDAVSIANGARVTGAILTGDDDDTVALRTGAVVTGRIDLGAGRDAITIDGSTLRAASDSASAIIGGVGADTVLLTNGARVTGAILTGDDDDAVTLRSGALAIGGVDTGAGNDSVTIDAASVQAANGAAVAITTGAGADALTLANGARVSGGVSLGDDDDTAQLRGGSVIAGTLDLGAGNDTLTLDAGSSAAALDGGTGSDTLLLTGTGDGSLGSVANFEILSVNAGNWTLQAPASFPTRASIASGASLTGSSATLGSNALAVAGTLVLAEASNATYAGTLTGNGQLIKTGTGALTLPGQSGFTGGINVAAGSLVLAGNVRSATTVQSGAILGGAGTLASLAAASGATLSPGAAASEIATLATTGAFSAGAGTVFVADTTAAGRSDQIAVGGAATIANGALLQINRDGGTYTPGTRYVVLTAANGISGAFTLVQAAGQGTEFRLLSGSNALTAVVARTAGSLSALAQTANQAAIAPAVAALGLGNAIYTPLTLLPADGDARVALSALSGEVHPSARLATVRDAQAIDSAVNVRLTSPQRGTGLWGQMLGRAGHDNGRFGAADTTRNTIGFVGGLDLALGDAKAPTGRVGAAIGHTRTILAPDGGSQSARIGNTHLVAYAAGAFGPIAVRAGLGYGWGALRTRRTVAFTGFGDSVRAEYDGNVFHSFAELGLKTGLSMMGGTIEPFVGIQSMRVHTSAFTETGGAAALAGRARTENYGFSDVGVRGITPITKRLQARSRLTWQHALDRVTPASALRFASNATPFTIQGASLSEDAATVALDLAWQPNRRFTLTSGYAGSIGNRGDDSILRVQMSVGF